ncbi:hypothetical protein HYX02_06105 [Candidatus Woesearchaeota archaeon]|nr:hypothetical protein [Candidatus Woesearchaeota archaeon]
MRLLYLLAVFILAIPPSYASWQTYQNDLRNTGISNGTGYLPLNTANFSIDIGMDFQPLVDDLDFNGNSEIVIFSNDSLIILSPQLDILDSVKTGTLLGQPTLFNFDNDGLTEIMFNARQNSTDYFFAYQYNNSGFYQEFNITLSHEANFGGIKCFGFNGMNYCVFKDEFNYINIVNMSSKTASSYNTSAHEETKHTVPAIGDIDNDGSLEAVFWFNEDNSSGYGFLVFDLINRSLKMSFNSSGIVDNIFSPLYGQFNLKGQPVLADLNNDDKLEIAASVFYDDANNEFSGNDLFTELFVYSPNGTKMFSKCALNHNNNIYCGTASVETEKWEGTNPFVLDYDRNGFDDICLIKDVKNGGGFQNMSLNCYNYSGAEIANVNLSTFPDGIQGNAMAADMNGDGEKEIITMTNIYLLNGTSIFFYNLDEFNPVAVDLDGNDGLDLLWTHGNLTKAFLDNNNYTIDLAVSDINFLKVNGTHVNVSALISNIGQVEANNVKVIVYNTETLENNTLVLSIKKGKNITFSSVIGLRENQEVLVSADYYNEINETDEGNNDAFKEFLGLPYVFVSAESQLSGVNAEFKEYIRKKLVSGYYTENEAQADAKVYIGKFNPRNKDKNIIILGNFEFGFDSGNIIYNEQVGVNPYSALAAAVTEESILQRNATHVMIAGNEIEGDIIGVKKFIENQALFLNAKDKEAVFIDDENIDALKVYDYLHLGGNSEHYNLDNEQFRKIVHNALYDEMFNVFDKDVVTNDGITLRLRNLKPNISNDYLEYLNSTGVPVEMPVVLAHGLFSNLTTWEVLGAELSNTGRDTWLIEITGGPGQDCDSCIDYSFYNLTDIFVPALLNGVLNFTGKDKMQYVGFSNGCRSALDSLERGKFDSNKVETFVAVGCPGAFEGTNLFLDLIKSNDGQVFQKLKDKGLNHATFSEISLITLINKNFIKDNGGKISNNLWKFYEEIILSNNDSQPGNINISNFNIIQGSALGNSDGIVLVQDESKIYENANKFSNKKKRFDVFAIHLTLDGSSRTKSILTKTLNKQELSFYEKSINLINQSS